MTAKLTLTAEAQGTQRMRIPPRSLRLCGSPKSWKA